MRLDVDTLLFSSTAARLSYLAVFALAGLRRPQDRFLLHWAGSVLLSMAGLWATVRIQAYPFFDPARGTMVYGVLGGSIALCWSGVRLFDGRPAPWTTVLAQGALPGLLYGGSLAAGLSPRLALAFMFVGLAAGTVRVLAALLWRAPDPDVWSRRGTALPLACYLAMFVASPVLLVSRPEQVADPDSAYLSLVMDQAGGLVIYIGLLAMPGERARLRLTRLATSDPLTGLLNRQGVAEALEQDGAGRCLPGRAQALILIDVDHFKRINDTFGHAAGDAVLVEVSRRLRDLCAGEDGILARWGGEEFLVVLRGTGREGAVLLAERLRGAVATEPVRLEPQTVAVTVSIGVADVEARRPPLQALQAADAALYAAKRGGRDRVRAAWQEAVAEVSGAS